MTVDPVKGSGRYINGEEHSTSVGDNPPGDPSQETLDPEYVVERIVDHEGTGDALQYRVRWYGYDAKDDTWEKAACIPPYLTKRYWNQVEKLRSKSLSKRTRHGKKTISSTHQEGDRKTKRL